MGDQLKQKMISAVAWSTIEKFGQQLLQFLAGLVFARLLMPEDFGVMGIIMIFVALSLILVESGFIFSLVRKKDITNIDYSTVFYFNLFTAFVIYIILFLIAPLIARFFNQPQLLLLVRVISSVLIINSLYLIPSAQLSRALNYKTLSKINLLSVVGGVVAGVVAAFMNAGVWALIIQQIVIHFLKMVFFYLAVKWKPVLSFQLSTLCEMWKYSLNILFTSLVNVLFNNIFVVILGKYYTKAEAGQFAQGNKLSETFSYTFQAIFAGSTFSLFAQVQDDIPRFRRILGEMTRRISLITIPIICILIVVAQPLITIIWTEKFLPAVDFFQLMSLSSILAPFYMLNLNALNARGKSAATMRIEILKKIVIIISIYFLYSFGLKVMLIAFVVGSLLSYPLSAFKIRQELHYPLIKQFRNLLPGIATGIITGTSASVLYYTNWSVYTTLVAQIAVSGSVYLLIVFFFHRELFIKVLDYAHRYLSFLKSHST